MDESSKAAQTICLSHNHPLEAVASQIIARKETPFIRANKDTFTMWTRSGEQRSRRGFLLFLAVALVVPSVTPFATASVSSNTNPRKPSSMVAGTPPSTSSSNQHLGRHMATADATAKEKKRLSIGDFMSFLKGKGQRNETWKQAEHSASLPSRLLFRYATPLLDLASDRHLEVEDAFEVNEKRSMNATVSSLANIYDRKRDKSLRKIEEQRLAGSDKVKASQSILLTKALLTHQRKMLLLTGFLRLVNTGIQAFPPILLSRLLRLIETGDQYPASKAFGAAVSLVAVLLTKMLIENQYFHYVVKMSTEVRGSLSGLIFDKSLRLPGGGSSVTHKTDKKNKKKRVALGTGGVLNLMQSDASIIESTAMQLHTIWDGPLQIAIYTGLLFKYLGPSVLYGIAVLLLTIPFNSFTLRVLNRLSKYENEAKDARTKRTSESIANMKLLKLQGWEQRFAEDIRSHRCDELQRHSNRGLVRALSQAVSNSVPALVLVVTLTAYVKTGRPVVASTIFTAISLFNQLRFPLFFYPMLIDSLANGRNAMRRISSYLASEEVVSYVEKRPAENGGGSVQISSGNFLWTSNKPPKDGEVAPPAYPALYDANLEVNAGEVLAVVGPVGSGKSALIKALLGELVPVPKAVVQGSIPSHADDMKSVGPPSPIIDKPLVVTHGNIAYCSQESWLPKGTIREAVVFGREYDEKRYLAAIRDAGLDDDIVETLDGKSSKAAATSGVLSHDTEVGEGGSSLSGGQRARVALARALYGDEDTKVFLLDDCLAALDARVGSTVFDRLTKRLRDSGAATVLVTNDPNLPRRCDRVALMEKVPSSSSCSTIADVGTYDELIERGYSLESVSADEIEEEDNEDSTSNNAGGFGSHSEQLIGHHDSTIRVVFDEYEVPINCTSPRCHADPDCQAALEKCPDFIVEKGATLLVDQEDNESVEEEVLGELRTKVDLDATPTEKKNTTESSVSTTAAPAKKLASADDAMAVGAVPLSAYITYAKSVRKPILIFAMLAAYLMSNGAQFYQQFIVAKWTELGQGNAMAAVLGTKYLRSLVNAAGVVSVCLWVRSFMTMRVGVRASEFLHSRMLTSVFEAPMKFFDATPSGQLLSRFGKEMQTVDQALPDSIGTVLYCFLQIFMAGAALGAVVTPAMILPIAAVGILYKNTMGRFRPGARDLKRVETKTRSPIYTHFGEALRGAEYIRSQEGSSSFWTQTHRSYTDTNLRAFSSVKALDRWLSCRLESLGNIVVFTAAVASVWLTRLGRLKSGSAGWGITQAMAITGLMTWAVRTLTDLETNMMSLVRVKELTDIESEEASLQSDTESNESRKQTKSKISKENSGVGEALEQLLSSQLPTVKAAPLNDKALDGWPWQGDLTMQNVSMRYNEASPLVLKDINLNVPKGTTLGVVGRSGSGKSSLLLTIFRLVEVEAGGRIEIDGVDLRSISLQRLREALAIIPQDPVLFAGTVAYNLDATGVASSEAMWEALEAASPTLAAQFRQSDGLETAVSEGGKNLSQGQRQLLCLARALLRKSKILVLDEATASVDPQTDQEVQATIKKEFVEKGVSVITVAHRLETVLGYDKIAVLGDGELLEYGSPKDLLQIRNGELRALVDADRLSQKKGAKKKSAGSEADADADAEAEAVLVAT